MIDENQNPWNTISNRLVYENPWIRVREDSVIHPNGELGIYGLVHYRDTAPWASCP
jgi:hypothetical protein